jgi:phosphoglycolate phosphatase-like HAD superfamily hydrolase
MGEILASWHDRFAKRSILDFVNTVCDSSSSQFVPQQERIAVFDNDGTLWSEQPFYFQGLFLFDRVRAMAPDYPEWATTQPFQAVLEKDWATLSEIGNKGLLELALVTHGGMTRTEFEELTSNWLTMSRHPTLNRMFTELVYTPMLELLDYLRNCGFKTFIVSGGGIEFIRTFSERVYGIPPEQVIGSSIFTRYEKRDGKPVLARIPELNFVDDGARKPVGIQQHIGQRPIASFGNSDGDLQMLEWTMAGKGARYAMVIHHDDEKREFAYDRKSASGRADRVLDEATERGLTMVSMKQDWKRVYAFEN